MAIPSRHAVPSPGGLVTRRPLSRGLPGACAAPPLWEGSPAAQREAGDDPEHCLRQQELAAPA